MKILFLSSVYPSPEAPVCGTYNEQLCRSLARHHLVRVVAPRPWWRVCLSWLKALRPRQAPEDRADSFHAANWQATANCTLPIDKTAGRDLGSTAAVPVSRPMYFYTPKVFRSFYGTFMWWSIGRHVEAVLKQFRPDCVLSYWVDPDGDAARRAASRAGVPVAVIVGGSDVLLLTANPRRRRRISHTLRNVHAVFCVSEGLRQAVIQLGAEPERVHTVYQGVDVCCFHRGNRAEARRLLRLPEGQCILLWVGRFVPVKGLDVLIQAFAVASRWNGYVHLYLVGDGPLRGDLERQVKRLHLEDRVHFVGPVSHERTPLWYRAANATVLSSWSEGLPNVLRESLACGTPFVSTNVGSVSELADPEFSILVPPGDVETLADALLRIGDERYQLGAARYGARSWDDMANEVSERLLQLCSSCSRERRRGKSASLCWTETATAWSRDRSTDEAAPGGPALSLPTAVTCDRGGTPSGVDGSTGQDLAYSTNECSSDVLENCPEDRSVGKATNVSTAPVQLL